MRALLLKLLFSLMLSLIILGTVLTALSWYVFNERNVEPRAAFHRAQKKTAFKPSEPCKSCGDGIIDKLVEHYSQSWKKQEDNSKKFRDLLSSDCHGLTKAIITQANTPLGSKVVYDGEKRKPLQVTPEIFSTFIKEHPFGNKSWDTCAVVGNGGILVNSSCGEKIDSAQFVIRCNLPPLQNDYKKDVGSKTDLVTANPSILVEKFRSLSERRRPFVESLRTYGNSLLLLPAFSYSHNTGVSLRALYSVQDFESPTRPVFFNPEYLQSLARFWRSQGLRAVRLSTGFMVASLALELCANVHIYGFWPFSQHPLRNQSLTNHYYDDRQSKKRVHAMPAEFDHLLRLHSQGVLRLHLGDCLPASSAGCSTEMSWASASGLSVPAGVVSSTLHNRSSQEPLAQLDTRVPGLSGLWAAQDPKKGSEPRTKQRSHRKKQK
ncbi:alpha-2,8-sialyltransferase 8E [Centroberyx affinis]|uniref:alpha-2,8-sialyltransferase 8E n=1 Tax=Centroberyx affinis TaxID=166261 RepID=UPI003A5BB479